MTKPTLQVLRDARELLSDPARWTQVGAFAIDERGNFVGTQSLEAKCFCVTGALLKIDPSVMRDRYDAAWASEAFRALNKQRVAQHGQRFEDIFQFNDSPDTTHADVLALFDAAIREEELKAQA